MISGLTPPLKKYEFPISTYKLQNIILAIDDVDTNLFCSLTDSTGSKDNALYYMDVLLNFETKKYYFHISYGDVNKFWINSEHSEIGLVMAIDSSGHSKMNSPELIDVFDKNFVSHIEKRAMKNN